ncbi:serine/threonine-protein kinase [Micromonospora sp. DT81.3]|uniref:serine/threonine-protein kinase n=1 Tax=Actinomycetes TaxID=1760 RepID=UPI003CFA3BA4
MTDVSFSSAAVGELLDGRYRLEQLIGTGGMASVYRATDETLGRTVAIKAFHPGAAGSADVVRRESEKRLLASLSHPALVTLFDAHLSNDDGAYLVMEYVDGGTLEARIEQGPIAPIDVAALGADLGEALHVAHAAGIVHRDVKPSNVLLRPPLISDHSFRAILADFGIAYLVDTARVTTPGMAMGTAAYIAPEQVRGAEPTPASDIYSLGLVLIESLTGTRAFPQQSPHEAVAARLSMPPVIPGTFGYRWRSLLTAMTALDPQDRPTALEVAARARKLEYDDVPPDVTGYVPDDADAVGSDSAVDGFVASTAVPRQLTAATALLPRGAEFAVPVSPSVARSGDPITAGASRRGRLWIALGAAAAVVAGLIVAVIVWTGTASTPPAPPALPQLEEPLDSHLDQLLDEVTP